MTKYSKINTYFFCNFSIKIKWLSCFFLIIIILLQPFEVLKKIAIFVLISCALAFSLSPMQWNGHKSTNKVASKPEIP